MLGGWGAVVLQLTITATVVIGLIGLVYWLVRRTAGGIGRLSHGRVPRLAVIDATSVDGRRRLVLVRRDNVEHLILIGGPTDVVIEQAIQRPRQRPARAQATTQGSEAHEAAAQSLPRENPPIPFPQPRPQPAAMHQQPAADRSFAPIRRITPARAEAIAPSQAPANEPEPLYVQPIEPMPAPEPAPIYAPSYNAEAATPQRRYSDYVNGGAQPHQEASPFASPEADSDTAAKVNDLEREMARLLGEITSKRPS
jgi:flagellar biogenesis protein FliO